MAEQTVTFSINVNPVTSAGQKAGLRKEEVDRGFTYMKNIIIENAAFLMVQKQERALKQSIDRTISSIVEKELSRMGRDVNRLIIGLPDSKARGRIGYQPRGTLSIVGGASRAMAGQLGDVNIGDATGPWPARNKQYLKRAKKLGGGKWFKVTGDLGRYLRNSSAYTAAYGPIKVEYTKAPKGTPTPEVVGVSRMSSGVGGRRSTVVTFGNVHVSALGTITSDMLNDPERRQPSPWRTGLFESFPDKIEAKLLNREETYRPFLEAFLSFYLTKAIPNAVFRQLEQVIQNDTVGAEKNVGVRKVSTRRFSRTQLQTISEQLKPLTQG